MYVIYLYLILYASIINANTKVTAFAIRTGILLLNNPNKNHNKVPNVKSEYINNEIPEVSFVRIVLIACGKKDVVVNMAAANPTNVILCIAFQLVYCFFYSR